MLAGVIDSNLEALTSALPNGCTAQTHALAVLSAERQPLLPDVPTSREPGSPASSARLEAPSSRPPARPGR